MAANRDNRPSAIHWSRLRSGMRSTVTRWKLAGPKVEAANSPKSARFFP